MTPSTASFSTFPIFSEVQINRLWSFIKSKGSSCAHFRLCHKGYELAFHGLTEDEYLQQYED
jgi:hypothetical protein